MHTMPTAQVFAATSEAESTVSGNKSHPVVTAITLPFLAVTVPECTELALRCGFPQILQTCVHR